MASMNKDRNKRNSADICLIFNEVDQYVHELMPPREIWNPEDSTPGQQMQSNLDPEFFSPSRIDKALHDRRRISREMKIKK